MKDFEINTTEVASNWVKNDECASLIWRVRKSGEESFDSLENTLDGRLSESPSYRDFCKTYLTFNCCKRQQFGVFSKTYLTQKPEPSTLIHHLACGILHNDQVHKIFNSKY